jgi:hypothetical protein
VELGHVFTRKPLTMLEFFQKWLKLLNGDQHPDVVSAVSRQSPRRKVLTDAFVRTLRPEAKHFRVWDARLPGLVLRVWPSGVKSFYASYCRNGQHRWYWVGKYPVVGVADARKVAGEVLLKVAMGQDPVAERKAPRAATFADAHKRYIAEWSSKRKAN